MVDKLIKGIKMKVADQTGEEVMEEQIRDYLADKDSTFEYKVVKDGGYIK